MANYIPNLRAKQRNWSRDKTWETSAETRQLVESSESFKAVQNQMNREASERASRMKAEKESNSEVQRWRRLTPEQRGREAAEKVAKTIKEHVDMGIYTEKGVKTFEDASRMAADIATKAERQKGE
jgi:hypothetical protein